MCQSDLLGYWSNRDDVNSSVVKIKEGGKMKSSLISLLAVAFILGGTTTASAWDNISPPEACELVESQPHVYLLDVRTDAEHKFVGHPDVSDGKIKNIQYWN